MKAQLCLSAMNNGVNIYKKSGPSRGEKDRY